MQELKLTQVQTPQELAKRGITDLGIYGPEITWEEDRFGFHYHGLLSTCVTSKPGENVVTISVKSVVTGEWNDLNLTRQQLAMLGKMLPHINE